MKKQGGRSAIVDEPWGEGAARDFERNIPKGFSTDWVPGFDGFPPGHEECTLLWDPTEAAARRAKGEKGLCPPPRMHPQPPPPPPPVRDRAGPGAPRLGAGSEPHADPFARDTRPSEAVRGRGHRGSPFVRPSR